MALTPIRRDSGLRPGAELLFKIQLPGTGTIFEN